MSLSNLIRRKSEPVGFATATPATFATQEGERGRTVASVATVAVAKSPQGQTAPPAKVGAGDTANAKSYAWLLHFPDREPMRVTFTPEATHTDALEAYPGALAAEPCTSSPAQAATPPRSGSIARVGAWLEHVGETDPATIRETLERCAADPEALRYFLERADEVLPPDVEDDRRTCYQCARLAQGGRCMAPTGLVSASGTYHPAMPHHPQRCRGYTPLLTETDQRPGTVRWHWLDDTTKRESRGLKEKRK